MRAAVHSWLQTTAVLRNSLWFGVLSDWQLGVKKNTTLHRDTKALPRYLNSLRVILQCAALPLLKWDSSDTFLESAEVMLDGPAKTWPVCVDCSKYWAHYSLQLAPPPSFPSSQLR